MKGGQMTTSILIQMLLLTLALVFASTTASAITIHNTYSPHVCALHSPAMDGMFSVVRRRMLLEKAMRMFLRRATWKPYSLSEMVLQPTPCSRLSTGLLPIQETCAHGMVLCVESIPKEWWPSFSHGWDCKFGGLGSLEYHRLSYNDLSGTIPVSLSNCTSLLDLVLGVNNLTGSIPTELGRLDKLQYISVNDNKLNTQIPAALGNSSSLEVLFIGGYTQLYETLYLQFNNFIGPIPDSIGKLKSVNELLITSNNISGSIPESISGLISVEVLDFSDNSLDGKIPKGITEYTALKRLILSQNKLIGNIPFSMGSCPSMTELILSSNSLSGGIPRTLSNCTSLRKIKLSNNSLNGSFDINYPPSLEVLSANTNDFSGTLPVSLAICTKLQLLDLRRSHLRGALPLYLANFQELRVLSLGYNQLQGTFPAGMVNLTSLQVLDLSNNKFDGQIPSNLENLQGFAKRGDPQIPGNSLYEDIRIVIKKHEYRLDYVMAANTILDLSSNNLSGQIPESIMNLSSLRLLNLSGNHFTGNCKIMPTELEELEVNANTKNKTSVAPSTSPSASNFKSICTAIDENVSMVAMGLGFRIAFGGTISVILWWDTLWLCIMALKIRRFYGVANSQTCS
ncbi:hypothetical protein SUGI_0816250 [Cryptomeria japonica]|nr:hypothetical protein SUGI_0816250 [Cryptomeria japonica]